MIGTTLKVSGDPEAISKGMGRIGPKLGSKLDGHMARRLGSMGAARLGGMTFARALGMGFIGGALTAAAGAMGSVVIHALSPDNLLATAEWSKALEDMSHQTGVSIDKLVVMEEALRLGGADSTDTSRMLSTLAKNLREAQTEGGPAADALQKLGVRWGDFAGMPLDEAFGSVMRKLGELGPGFKGAENAISTLFGGGRAYKLLAFARDFDNNMAQARNNVGQLAASMNGSAPRIAKLFEGLGRFENFKRSLASIAIEEGMRLFGGPGGADRLFDNLDVEKLRPQIRQAVNVIGRNIEAALTGGTLDDIGRGIGRSLAPGIMEGMRPDVFDNPKIIPFLKARLELVRDIHGRMLGGR